jgi:hypothetical protein
VATSLSRATPYIENSTFVRVRHGQIWSYSRRAQADSAADAPKVIELSPDDKRLLYDAVASKVVLQTGYQSRIALRDSVIRCVQHGVVNLGKFFALQRDGERMPDDLSHVLSDPSDRPIRLTRDNAGVYVNLLWAVGLANHMVGNFPSPLMGDSLRSFASTAGWTREEALDGVEPRGRGRGEMECPSRMIGEPFEDVGLFVGGIVVDDGVDDFSGRHGALDGVEEANELLGEVTPER